MEEGVLKEVKKRKISAMAAGDSGGAQPPQTPWSGMIIDPYVWLLFGFYSMFAMPGKRIRYNRIADMVSLLISYENGPNQPSTERQPEDLHTSIVDLWSEARIGKIV